ncbi:MAG: hypothetical protein A2Z70_02480 [Chloroflexi bacterium RBG_13_48_17]|nr:MAG: hypothetical protein A2Z70_02480 [Chloroflexi bacterium RBG_13_48_17]
MARKLDDIFNECYERIRSGESLESCIRSYPQYRAQLEPLLRTTFDIGRRVSYIHPRPEFKHWARVRIESAQRYPRQQTRTETPAASTWWRHGWAVAVSVGIVLVLTTGTTMAASSQALPTQPLYPVKLATEQVRLALAVSDENKAQVQTELVQERAKEVEAMANAGETDEAAKAVDRYNDQFEKALAAILKAEGTQPPPVIPPAETLPPETATPPAVVTPPVVTTASENTTPAETTTPATTETQPPVTEEQPTTTEEQPSVTEEQPTVTEEQPTVTEEQPAVTEEQPTATTTQDKGKTSQTDKLRNALDKSNNKSLQALKEAKEKASHNTKSDWQKTIDTMKKNQEKSPTTTDTTSQSDNKTTSSPASPSPTKQLPSRWHR